MRDDLMKDGENRAVRTFLLFYGGNRGGALTTDAMRTNLELAGWENCWPDWAKRNQTLTKSGAQDWIRFLFALEAAEDKAVVKRCPFVQGQRLSLLVPSAFWTSEEIRTMNEVKPVERKFYVVETKPDPTIESGFVVRVIPAITPHPVGAGLKWYDVSFFVSDPNQTAPEKAKRVEWEIKPAMFVKYQTVTHVKTNGVYHIVLTPDDCRIEATGEPAYAYRAYVTNAAGDVVEGKEIWIRGQTEMEDGQFVLCEQSGRSVIPDLIGPRTREAIRDLGMRVYPPFLPPSQYGGLQPAEWTEPMADTLKGTIFDPSHPDYVKPDDDPVLGGTVSFVDEQAALNGALLGSPPGSLFVDVTDAGNEALVLVPKEKEGEA